MRKRPAVGFGSAPCDRCIHNFEELEGGGPHREAVREAIRQVLEWGGPWDVEDEESRRQNLERGMRHLRLVIETYCPPDIATWADCTHHRLTNRMIADMAGDLIDGDFRYFLQTHWAAITGTWE